MPIEYDRLVRQRFLGIVSRNRYRYLEGKPLTPVQKQEVLAECFFLYARRVFTSASKDAREQWRAASLIAGGESWLRAGERAGGDMADKKQRLAVQGWANLSLTDNDKEAIRAQVVSVEDILYEVAAMVEGGYRFSVTPDDYSGGLQASLVCGNEDDDNYGYGLSARHPDFDLVIRTLYHKVQLLRGTPWSQCATKPSVPEWG